MTPRFGGGPVGTADSYKKAGVDIDSGNEAVRLIAGEVARTMRPEVVAGVGGFGALFAPRVAGMEQPLLVSACDGVGTKLKIAFLMDRHDTIGRDCVAMNVNDLLVSGAEPIFFLDYIATGRMEPGKIALIVKGMADGCVEAGCALIGGETAEMPGFYREGEYDLAGFAVGLVDRRFLVDGSGTAPGDVLVGLPSSGLHSNGFSLVRKLLLEENSFRLSDHVDELGCSLGEELLKPTRIYVRIVREFIRKFPVKAMAHITGGGLIENIPRSLAPGVTALVRWGSWEIPPVFELVSRVGGISRGELARVFNLGVGFVLVLPALEADGALRWLRDAGEKAVLIGELVEGEGPLTLV